MKELPEGYVRVSVLVTTAEYKKIQRAATVTPRKTMSEAIRYLMGWPYVPAGFLRATGISKDRRKKPEHPFAVRQRPSHE